MPYVNKQHISGLFTNPSESAQDWLDDDDPLVVAYLASVADVSTPAPPPVVQLADVLVAKGVITQSDVDAMTLQQDGVA